MSDFTRGNTFASDDKVTPAGLNSLVESATVTNVSLSELGVSFKSIFYSDVDPGVTDGRIWYDTTAGQEGLKYAFISPSNASVAGWLYATPRREAYYWADTSVSVGSPLFIAHRNNTETQLAAHAYDGLMLLKAYLVTGSTDATGSGPVLVVSQESRTGAGPVKCAWAGLIPADTFNSQVTQHYPLFIDHHDALAFKSLINTPSSILTNIVGYWHLDGASGATRIDSGGNGLHLADVNTPVADTTGQIATAPDFNASTSEKLRHADDALLDITADLTISCWVKLNDKSAQRVFVSKWNNADTGRSYKLFYGAGADRFHFAVTSDGTTTTQTTVNADTLGSPSTGTWYFIVARHDDTSGEISISVNAGTADTAAHASGIFSGNSALNVGLDENNVNPMDGQIDEVAIWSRLLTDAEVTTVYNGGTGIVLESITGTPELARSSIYGTVLHDQTITLPLSAAGFILWGTGPVIQDINQT